jgi:alcohol dehydrogenase class IV
MVEAATNKYANAGNNLYAHEAIRLVAHNLLKALENPKDIAAREALQRAAAYGGVAIDNCGTAIAHNIGHALGSLKPIHHGHAVGVAMLASMQWNIADDDGAYAASAAAMGVPATAQDFAKAYEKLLRASGVKIDLSQQFADVSPQTLAAQMARPENAAMLTSNKRTASEADLQMLAKAVLTQV